MIGRVDFDPGFMALVVGALAGLAGALTGSRGNTAGAVFAVIALVGMGVATFLQMQKAPEEPPTAPGPQIEVEWTEAKARDWYKQAQSDAEGYMQLDGSAASVRRFMVERDYTHATSPDAIPADDLQHFYDVDSRDLAWMVENQPAFEAWNERMKGHISGRIRTQLSAPPPAPATGVAKIGAANLAFLLLGVAVAFGLGRIGLGRKGR